MLYVDKVNCCNGHEHLSTLINYKVFNVLCSVALNVQWRAIQGKGSFLAGTIDVRSAYYIDIALKMISIIRRVSCPSYFPGKRGSYPTNVIVIYDENILISSSI